MLRIEITAFTSFLIENREVFIERVNLPTDHFLAIKYELFIRDKGVKLVEQWYISCKINARFLGISKPAVVSLKL